MSKDIARVISAILGIFVIGTSVSALGTDTDGLRSILLPIILGGILLYFAATGRSIGFGRKDDRD